jgi:hypothetical protein
MVIKSSSASEVRHLIEALGGDDVVRREAAIARLAILGDRAVDRLLAAFSAAAGRENRLAILRALEPMGDPRTLAVARQSLREDGDLAIAATGILRGLLGARHADAAAAALDTLVSIALDRSAARRLRVAAYEALHDVPGDVREHVAAALREDAGPAILAPGDARGDAVAADAVWQDALDGRLPDHPDALREAALARAPSAALGVLQKLVDAVRAHEGAMREPDARAAWRNVRGTLHQALALRGSHVAVYDLRESLEGTREPLPTSFLAALHVVGDESCLEPLAAAYARAEDTRWRVQVRDAFRAIARRERITRRHSAAKRIAGKWPDAMHDLMARD